MGWQAVEGDNQNRMEMPTWPVKNVKMVCVCVCFVSFFIFPPYNFKNNNHFLGTER